MLMGSFHKTLREDVVVYIRKKIVRNEIKPGVKINEAALASELGISRGPVREALRQIEQEGLVIYYPNKGCIVRTLCPKDVFNTYILRANLEILSVKMCNGIFSNETIKMMDENIQKIECAALSNNLDQLIDVDEEFHSLIVKEANMEKLVSIWESLSGFNISIFYSVFIANIVSNEQRVLNHKSIISTIKSGNTKEICKVIQTHYFNTCKKMFSNENMNVELWENLEL